MTVVRNLTSKPCEVHRRHGKPKPTYTEFHHVVPRAWQQLYTPPAGFGEIHYGTWRNDGEVQQLWDNRGVSVCCTGHGNVHHWLVKIVKELVLDGADRDAGEERLVIAVKTIKASGRDDDVKTALEAVRRFWAAGGSLVQHLGPTHTWGYK